MINWKECERKRLLPNLRHYPCIWLEGLRKTTKILSQDIRSSLRDLNQGPPEYEAGVLTTQPRRSVIRLYVLNIFCHYSASFTHSSIHRRL
jgi:hypothetical protein